MVIGRDIIPVHIIDTYTQFPAAAAASAVVSMATTSSGDFNNCLKAGFYSGAASTFTTYEDGSNSTLSTATSPTRTTQTFEVDVQDLIDANVANAAIGTNLLIAGYIRHTGSSASDFLWEMGSGAVVASSLSNGVAMAGMEVAEDREDEQDNTTMTDGTPRGIYHSFGVEDSGSGFYIFRLTWGGGRGGATYPADGDSMTIRVTGGAEVDGSTESEPHDIIIEFTL